LSDRPGRVAVVSDIHSNLAALEAVLAAIDADPPDAIWCLGDVVGYAARPNECVALVRERASLCLAGNHDLAVRGTIDLREFSGDAGIAAGWTQGVLDDDARAYLDGLDTHATAGGVALFHASARDPVWEYVLSDDAAIATLLLTSEQVVLVGHSHVALQVALEDGTLLAGGLAPDGLRLELGETRWLFNPGSVGQPRDGDPRAAWLELDLAAGAVTFRRVAYDIERTQAEIVDAGLPLALAARLAVGQ
jgi:diadenosine tetraphosphatase ApaH/serine/threonine PP2A family protein phosphatase